jgi:hypothetical protein
VKPVANIDPRLMSKINAAAAGRGEAGVGEEENITAVMTLARDRESTGMAAQDTKTETNLVHDLLTRTENITHEKPISIKYLDKLGVLIVEGNSTFLRQLIENPEISSATLSEEEK